MKNKIRKHKKYLFIYYICTKNNGIKRFPFNEEYIFKNVYLAMVNMNNGNKKVINMKIPLLLPKKNIKY